jgi:lysylphosphatidylglycerol synthetase-like protein (DUF2156 family)
MHFAMRWTMTPEERDWWRGRGGPVISRQCGFVVAAAVAFGLLTLGFLAVLHGDTEWAAWRFLTAAALFTLGCRVWGGDGRAALAMMALLPLIILPGHAIAYREHHGYYADHLGFWLAITTAALAAWWRIFFLAYRAERRACHQLADHLRDFLDEGH